MTKEETAKKLIKRVERLSQEYWHSFRMKGINHAEWCKYYFNMMRTGERLKALGVEYKPRSKRYPVEFRELFK